VCPGATNSSAEYNKAMFLAVDGVAGKAFPRIDNNDTLAALAHPECPGGVRGNGTQPCHTVDRAVPGGRAEYLMEGGDLDSMCYACVCTLSTLEAERAALNGMLGEDYCAEMAAKQADAEFWGTVATFIVVAINQILKQGIRRTSWFARAHTLEEEMWTTTRGVYLCQVLNTAILMLLLKSNLGGEKLIGRLPGDHYDTVNAKWYATVGAPLVKTMIIQFMTPPGVHLFMHFVVNNLRRKIGRHGGARLQKCSKGALGTVTQNQLNASQAPSGFEIAAGYGEVLLAMSVTMLFGSGIPLLYHVAAVGFFVRYTVDKWVIVHVARKPPLYSEKLFETFDEIFAMWLLVHAAMAVYFLASAGVDATGSPSGYVFLKVQLILPKLKLNLGEDFSFFGLGGGASSASSLSADDAGGDMHPHVWPMFGSLCAVLLGVLFKFFCKCACWQRCCCCARPQPEDEMEETLPPFSEAYQAGLIINEDDDYMMDAYEDLMDFEEAFQDALNQSWRKREPPFDDFEFYRRCSLATDPVLRNWVGGADAAHISRAGHGGAPRQEP